MDDLFTIRPRTRQLWDRLYQSNYTPSIDALWAEIRGDREVLKEEVRRLLLEKIAEKRQQRAEPQTNANSVSPAPAPPVAPSAPPAWQPPPFHRRPRGTKPGERAKLPPHEAQHLQTWLLQYAAAQQMPLAEIGYRISMSKSAIEGMARGQPPDITFSLASRLSQGLNVPYETIVGPAEPPAPEPAPPVIPDPAMTTPPDGVRATPEPYGPQVLALLTQMVEGISGTNESLADLLTNVIALRETTARAHGTLAAVLRVLEAERAQGPTLAPTSKLTANEALFGKGPRS